MPGREYLSRQAQTLLKLARITRDPNVTAALTDKALDLKARLDETPVAPDAPAEPTDIQNTKPR